MRIIVFLFFSLASNATFAQKDRVNATLVLKNTDTIRGLINRSDLNNLHKRIDLYLIGKTDTYKTYEFVSIDKIVINGKEEFYLWDGVLDLSYIDKYLLDVKKEQETKRDTIWLKALYKGPVVSLLGYKTETKTHFFVQENTTIEALLIRYEKLDHFYAEWGPIGRTQKYKTYPYYQNQLCRFFNWPKYKRIKYQIDGADYNEKSLKKILESINTIRSEP